jgi:NADH:ubiquinone oxidoreductase subunit F (NADH-binding)/ferredoxin/(2Fe-2S) ferredoxin
MKVRTRRDLESAKERGLASLCPPKPKITVGMASCEQASGATAVLEALQREVDRRKLDVVISLRGCVGWCSKEPLVDVLLPDKPRVAYGNVSPEQVSQLLDLVERGEADSEWALYRMDEEENIVEDVKIPYCRDGVPEGMEPIPTIASLPFYRRQLKIALRNSGLVGPDSIEEFIARGGYSAALKVVTEMSPEEVIAEITRSGLRGRGGAGFPTGAKWKLCREAEGDTKYIVCNADEGDPGAYMDRSILEGDPHSILEGMLIGAYAIGAAKGYIYVRAEYPIAIQYLQAAIEQAREYGLLGDNIFGSNFSFDVHLSKGAGAFVCGEETALIASIEGNVGKPRPRPPFPAEKGLWGKPTNINNVETWASVPVILARGGQWYAGIGTEKSKGTKVFSLVGNVKSTGLVEVPMGTTLAETIDDVGGGIENDREFKAVQTGGPSGGCIPKEFIDMPVDYERLAEIGAIMGSGGMVVMDDGVCMADIARFFLSFTADESCGKCSPCRLGTKIMLNILNDITEGRGQEGDVELLEDLAHKIKALSLCGLGQTAPNPVLTTIKYFRDEYEAHVRERRCPAAVCKALITFSIDPELCTGCHLCVKACPEGAITGTPKEPHLLDQDKCTKCGACFEVCKFDAVTKR